MDTRLQRALKREAARAAGSGPLKAPKTKTAGGGTATSAPESEDHKFEEWKKERYSTIRVRHRDGTEEWWPKYQIPADEYFDEVSEAELRERMAEPLVETEIPPRAKKLN